jgi:DNA-binding MarR family transcriptional regulator
MPRKTTRKPTAADSGGQVAPLRWTLDDAYCGPGHLIRRLQQIAVAIFMDEFKDLDITPVQHIALVAVRDRPGLEQQAIADLIAIDRSSAGRVIQFLEQRGLIARVTPKNNRRTKQAFVTPAGTRLLTQTARLIRRAEERILKVLNEKEQRAFMEQLIKLVDINNTLSRAPLRMRADALAALAAPSWRPGASKRWISAAE